MFDFRLFPGTNFNRINLDWIFSKLKELQEGQSTVTEAAEEATAAADEATAAAEAATQAASDAIEAIETVTETAEDAQTRAQAAELTAARAESNANTAISDAATASAAATNAATAAAAAQQTANSAVTAAAAAQQTANGAATAAAAAQQTADSAFNTSNSQYVKTPDGTLICWGSGSLVTGSGTSEGTATVTFPQTYSAAPAVICCMRASAYNRRIHVSNTISTSSFDAVGAALSGDGNVDVWFYWVSIGRWE